MTINKKGTPEKIKSVFVMNERQFDSLYDDIVKENRLVKCPKCGKLLSKISIDKSKTIQHKGLKAIIVDGDVYMKCPVCETPISFK